MLEHHLYVAEKLCELRAPARPPSREPHAAAESVGHAWLRVRLAVLVGWVVAMLGALQRTPDPTSETRRPSTP